MKPIIALAMSLFLSVVGMAVPILAATSPFALNISAPETMKSGVPIKVEISLTNNSTQGVRIYSQISPEQAEQTFSIEVRRQNSPVVPQTAYGLTLNSQADDASKRMAGIDPSFTSGVLAPGDSIEESSIVSNLYDMRAPGNYVIQVERHLSNGVVVQSNELIVTVTR